MTPKWIHSNAVITGPHALQSKYFEILPTGQSFQRALQVQLVAPNILTSTDSVTVTVTVAVDVSYASSNDHDPVIGISDGKSFIGFIAHDRHSYPCDALEGDSSTDTMKNIPTLIHGPLVSSRRYSSGIKIQLKPAEKWGSCHTEHDGGYTNVANYQHSFDLSGGLYVEIYHKDASEKYRIKYIVVDADLD